MAAMFSTVIVPLDGSEEAAVALGPAGAVAHYLDVALQVVARSQGPEDGALMTAITQQLSALGDVDRDVDLAPLDGSVGDAIVAALDAAEAPLLVMSTHGRGRSAGIVGSVATEVLSQTTHPALLFGPSYQRGRFRLHGPMLVAAGEDEIGSSAIAVAGGLVRAFDYEPCVVNVVDPHTARQLEKAQGGAFDTDATPESGPARRLASALSEATGGGAPDFRVLVDRKPARAVTDWAESTSAALIVVGTHARSGWDLLTHGSVTADIVAAAPCAVLAVAPGS